MTEIDKKAIEEMAHDLCGRCQDGICVVDGKPCNLDLDCTCQINATTLYNAGYRKQSEGEWISVEERMPLNFESVLVLATSRFEDDGYDVLIAYHDRGEWEERCVHGDGNTVYAHVKYWMPLPEPPKGEKHDPA